MDHMFKLTEGDSTLYLGSKSYFYKCLVCGFQKHELILSEQLYYTTYYPAFFYDENISNWIQANDLTCNEFLMCSVMK